jgi:hypothetical protein
MLWGGKPEGRHGGKKQRVVTNVLDCTVVISRSVVTESIVSKNGMASSPPNYDEDIEAQAHDSPPEFTEYTPEFFNTDIGKTISHDPHLNTDGSLFISYSFMAQTKL